MATSDNRTEKATPKRRHEARQRGQVARTPELATALILAVSVALLLALAPKLLGLFQELLASGLGRIATPEAVSREGLGELLGWAGSATVAILAPFFVATLLVALLAGVVQVGFKVSLKAAAPSLKKLNPLQGAKRLVSPNSLVEALKTIAKVAIVGLAAFVAIRGRLTELVTAVGMPPAEMLARISGIVLAVLLYVVAAYLVLAFADWWWQRRRHEKQLRMSKDEVKREARDADLAPEVRGKIRQKQVETARRRMFAEVPTADVVVTNPTHYAVALRYDGSKPAPEVVAKGRGHIALAIRRIAEEHEVPVLRNAPLARSLYREVELGQLIPEAFFGAVAEVLAYVFRTARRRGPTPARRVLARA